MGVVCTHCGAPANDGDRFCRRCGAAVSSTQTASDPLVGRTVGGAYTLQELIGVGGMGRVYRAEQTVLGRTVAVKVIHPHLLGDEQTVARFYTEARAASRLNHPNSVSIIDFGRTDDGILYLVMEHLNGKDLAMVMHEEGPLPFERVVDILVGVLGALSEAHALGVVHRDLKPENVILKPLRSGDDLVKVVDFGLATIVTGAGSTSITTPGLVCGTPDYMSPEQGKGELVDGRGDLYSLGVVLYELLVDQLPFEDETPTKVVLRHIGDPVPDPAKAAPHRKIPPELAAVAVKALQKSPADRFQTAAEMQEALRAALDASQTRASQPLIGTASAPCRACGADNPPTQRFCGACGARVTSTISRPKVAPQRVTPARPSFLPPVTNKPLVGRAEEVLQLRGLLAEAKDHPVRVHITGEPGAGKTRLLKELSQLAEAEGDVVAAATPHPLRAPVPFAPVRALIAALLDVDQAALGVLASQEGRLADPLARAGIEEVVKPTGLRGFEERGRAGAVAAALAYAVQTAAARSRTGRVVVIVDDLPACDGSSRDVLKLAAKAARGGVLFCTAGFGAVEEPEHVIVLHGLDQAATARFLANEPDAELRASLGGTTRLMLPLYLEQIQALAGTLGADELPPPRLADAVAQRLDRLDLPARRLIQAAAVLGDRCGFDSLRGIIGGEDMSGLQTLNERQLLRVTGDGIEFPHPFVRDLVEASIPAEARRALHERALRLATDRDEPLEVRAEHAYGAGEPMSALMLLERMGDAALKRGDAHTAVLGYRRALELARREMLETGDFMLEGALVTFSRKLGEALDRRGDVAGADGVLREALDLAGPHSAERGRMLLALGRVAERRDRPRDAARLLGQALELATTQHEQELEASVQVAMAELRRSEGDNIGAVNAFNRSIEIMDGNGQVVRRARTLVEIAEVLVDLGDGEMAVRHLEEARELSEKSSLPSLVAAATGALGAVDELEGNASRASARYREAARLAAEAGDAKGHERWKAAASAIG